MIFALLKQLTGTLLIATGGIIVWSLDGILSFILGALLMALGNMAFNLEVYFN